MRANNLQKFRLGVFVLSGISLLIIALYFIGEKRNLFGNTAHLYAVFNNVAGLRTGNSVRYSGIHVGTVQSIRIVNDTNIRVEMAIESDVISHIRRDAIATIGSDGLVGSMVVNIFPGRKSGPSIAAGGEIRTYNRIRTEDLLNTLNVTNENAALLTVDLLKITHQINEGKGSIGTLLRDETMANDLKATMSNLRIVTAKASASVASFEKAIDDMDNPGTVIDLVKDTATAGRIRRMLTHLESASRSADSTLIHFNAMASNARSGDGAINYLSNDPGAAEKMDSILIRLNTAGRLLNEDLEALQHSFLLRGYFRKKRTEAQKSTKR